ncbi:MAG TPA: Mrp/NBP35 family ATP-binding protein [Tepidisphaeraceae bacterium]|jgi:ATP-binding protein involved in chromosome partitioning|nr:Mrp/NBP35 family ATP-binding protein [Tepidisphaeraceae bacterium]
MPLSRDQVLSALQSITDPRLGTNIVVGKVVQEIQLDGNDVYVRLDLSPLSGESKETIRGKVEQALKAAGASQVHITLTAQPQPRGPAAAGQPAANRPLPQVKNFIAVGAGKGGVGKSTVALNLAVGLSRTGADVGLMDGDIYGPSMPTMLGIKGLAPQVDGGRIVPFHVHGIHAITIGALVEPDKPLIWRGPMAHGAFKQLLIDNTVWPELDYLIIDLPPGTGDVPLSLCQMLPITGAVVVATPQQVALDDAVRAVRMFQQLEAPLLGLVENMSYFIADDGSEHDIFGRGGTEHAARQLGLPYLGELPMFTPLRKNSDAGTPQMNFEGDPKLRQALELIVRNLKIEVEKRNARMAGPKLNII